MAQKRPYTVELIQDKDVENVMQLVKRYNNNDEGSTATIDSDLLALSKKESFNLPCFFPELIGTKFQYDWLRGLGVKDLQEDRKKELLSYFTLNKTFYIDEPLNKAVGLCDSGTDSCPELDEYCKHSLLEGLSFKAVDKEGNIIGVMISGVCKLDSNGNDYKIQADLCQNTKFKKILYIIARREEYSRLWERFPQDERLVEVKVAATLPSWRKMGIMNALLERTEVATKQHGLRLLRMDTSSAYSAKAAERLGFTCVYKELYTNIQMDGQPLIVPEPPHLDDRVYIKVLS